MVSMGVSLATLAVWRANAPIGNIRWGAPTWWACCLVGLTCCNIGHFFHGQLLQRVHADTGQPPLAPLLGDTTGEQRCGIPLADYTAADLFSAVANEEANALCEAKSECPIGWAPSPAHADWHKCYRAPPVLTDHPGCAEVCLSEASQARYPQSDIEGALRKAQDAKVAAATIDQARTEFETIKLTVARELLHRLEKDAAVDIAAITELVAQGAPRSEPRALRRTPSGPALRPLHSALACVGSQAENEFVTRHVLHGRKHWIGMHRSAAHMDDPTWAPRWAAHDKCGSFANWAPDAFKKKYGRDYGRADCVVLQGSGMWQHRACHRTEYRCLCELDARTLPSYGNESRALIDRAHADAWHTASNAFRLYFALVVVPTAVVLTRSVLLRSAPAATERGRGGAGKLSDGVSDRLLHRLHLAAECSAKLRFWTVHLVAALGLIILTASWLP